MSSAIRFNLDQSKILSFGKELTLSFRSGLLINFRGKFRVRSAKHRDAV